MDYLPSVREPTKKLDLKTKFLWTGVALVIYFALSFIPLYGLSANYKSQFEALAVLLAASFGSVISLGIGPIVTASIILQLLTSAGIVKLDVSTEEGKKKYSAINKVFGIVFIVFENALYVMSGALPSQTGSAFNISIMILQLILGGLLLLFLDEVTTKWGIGSGISLFIAAGVGVQIISSGLSPFTDPTNPTLPTGAVYKVFALAFQGLFNEAFWPLMGILATIIVFVLAVYLQSVKIEIPLSFGRVRGTAIKWPLKFIYTSNMPVILTAAFIASLQFWGLMMFNIGLPVLGYFEPDANGQMVAVSGLARYINPPTLRTLITQFNSADVTSFFVYLAMMTIGSTLFSVMWVLIGNQDSGSVADQILNSGLQVPGFRRDKRTIERLLNRYIMPLTVLGGFSVGVLAAVADLLGALSRGTGILLAVIIIYQFYEQISKESMEDAHPLLQKFFK